LAAGSVPTVTTTPLHRPGRPACGRSPDLERYVAAIVDRAPPLTVAQRDTLAVLLAGPVPPDADRPGEAGAARPVGATG